MKLKQKQPGRVPAAGVLPGRLCSRPVCFWMKATPAEPGDPGSRGGGTQLPLGQLQSLLTIVFSSLKRVSPLALASSSPGQSSWGSETNSNRLFFLEVRSMRDRGGRVKNMALAQAAPGGRACHATRGTSGARFGLSGPQQPRL